MVQEGNKTFDVEEAFDWYLSNNQWRLLFSSLYVKTLNTGSGDGNVPWHSRKLHQSLNSHFIIDSFLSVIQYSQISSPCQCCYTLLTWCLGHAATPSQGLRSMPEEKGSVLMWLRAQEMEFDSSMVVLSLWWITLYHWVGLSSEWWSCFEVGCYVETRDRLLYNIWFFICTSFMCFSMFSPTYHTTCWTVDAHDREE